MVARKIVQNLSARCGRNLVRCFIPTAANTDAFRRGLGLVLHKSIIDSSTPNSNRKTTRQDGAKPRQSEQESSSLSPDRHWWYGHGVTRGALEVRGSHSHRLR